MKKTYLIPSTKIFIIRHHHILAGSITATDGGVETNGYEEATEGTYSACTKYRCVSDDTWDELW